MQIPASTTLNPVRLGLAPMEGVSELALRLWFALTSPPAFTWTPFLRVTDTFPASIPKLFAPELSILKTAVPYALIPQLMGSRVEDVCRTSDLLLKDTPFIDLNCGCPSPTVVGNRSGSSLLESADIFSDFVGRTSSYVGSGKLSVKMRTGFHDRGEFDALLSAISNTPLAQLTVHGRTRPDRYRGKANWDLIATASRVVSYPVVGSGDILDTESLETASNAAPLVRTMIIGRGALRNPWIFGPHRHIPLLEPLVAFALFQEIGISGSDGLVHIAKEGHAMHAAGVDQDMWVRMIELLQTHAALTTKSWHEIEVSPRAFARVKMLWSYYRSSLPNMFMEPTLLRAKALPEFLQHLESIGRDHGLNLKRIPIEYRSDLDWMYSGQGKSSDSA